MTSPQWSVVIPALNEARRLPPYLARVVSYFDARKKPYEVIVVDDGATPIEELDRFEPVLAAGADIVIGSRMVADASVAVGASA